MSTTPLQKTVPAAEEIAQAIADIEVVLNNLSDFDADWLKPKKP